jgi:hypothetical protein
LSFATEENEVAIKTFEVGDEVAQLRIYNEAAAQLPKFKAATVDEIRRRCKAPDFDPSTRFFAIQDGKPVAYAGFQANGRVSYPWCHKGHEALAEPLFEHVLKALQERGLRRIFVAYRADWPRQSEFFLDHGFHQAREMVNFVADLADLPTPTATPGMRVTPLRSSDLPAVLELSPGVIRIQSLPELENYFFHNPRFAPDALYVLRGSDGEPAALGLVIVNPAYADAKQVDAGMPCFRLGAFGTEGMQTKRINGMFSFVAKSAETNRLGLDALFHAAVLLRSTELGALAAQVPSDAQHLLRFYQSHFRRQGSFLVLERELGS